MYNPARHNPAGCPLFHLSRHGGQRGSETKRRHEMASIERARATAMVPKACSVGRRHCCRGPDRCRPGSRVHDQGRRRRLECPRSVRTCRSDDWCRSQHRAQARRRWCKRCSPSVTPCISRLRRAWTAPTGCCSSSTSRTCIWTRFMTRGSVRDPNAGVGSPPRAVRARDCRAASRSPTCAAPAPFAAQCPSGSGSQFGQYGCDSPAELVRETARVMRSVLPDPDFILIAGDLTRHAANELPGDPADVRVRGASCLPVPTAPTARCRQCKAPGAWWPTRRSSSWTRSRAFPSPT